MPYKDKKTKLLKMKLLYDERKLKGLCVACGEKNDTPERVYCSWCSEKRVLARKRYKNGGCGHHDCTTCPYPYCKASQKEIDRRERKAHENSKKSWKEINQRWKEAGLCFRCGKEIEEGLKSVCRSCQDKQNKNKRKYYRKNHVDKYHDKNLCHVCHKYPLVEGYNTCEKCLERCRKNAKRMNEIKTDNGYFRTSNKLFFLSSIIQNKSHKVNK